VEAHAPASTKQTIDISAEQFEDSPNAEVLMAEIEVLIAMNGQLNDALERRESESREEQESLLCQIAALRSECDEHIHGNEVLSAELTRAHETIRVLTQSLKAAQDRVATVPLVARDGGRDVSKRDACSQCTDVSNSNNCQEAHGVSRKESDAPVEAISSTPQLELTLLDDANSVSESVSGRLGFGLNEGDSVVDMMDLSSPQQQQRVPSARDAWRKREQEKELAKLRQIASEREAGASKLKEQVAVLKGRLQELESEKAASSARIIHLEKVEAGFLEELTALRHKDETQRQTVTKLQGQVGAVFLYSTSLTC
jgi:chromosome segregation ATPase